MNTPAPKTSPDAALGNLMAAALDVPAPDQPKAPDDTLARTGNTADHQAGWFAGMEQGQANAKDNAAIHAGVPDGWKLVPITPTIDMVVDGQDAGGILGPRAKRIYAAMLAAAPAAPGVSTVQDERRPDACPRCDGSGHISVPSDNSPDAREVDVCCDHCQGSGAAVVAAKYLAAALAGEKYRHMQLYSEYKNFHRSLCARFGYGHDEVHFRRDLLSLEEAIAAMRPAPAAGDTLALLDHPLLREVLGYIEDAGPADVWGAAQSWMSLRDVALAAQRKGDA